MVASLSSNMTVGLAESFGIAARSAECEKSYHAVAAAMRVYAGMSVKLWFNFLRKRHSRAVSLHALYAASENFPGPLGPVASTVMKMGCFPLCGLTRPYSEPSDDLTKEVSRLLTTPSEIRAMFEEGIYSAPEGTIHQMTDLINALPICVEADKVATSLRREKREPTADETNLIAKADALRDAFIQVDVFEHATAAEAQPGYVRPALAGTEERFASMEQTVFKEAA